MKRGWFVYLLGLLAVGLALLVLLWRPWEPPPGPEAVGEAASQADVVWLTIVKRSGGPCRVIVTGGARGAANSASASLAAGEARSAPLEFPSPYTIAAVTVTRAGQERRRDLNLTLNGGHRYDLIIEPDNMVAVAPASP